MDWCSLHGSTGSPASSGSAAGAVVLAAFVEAVFVL
jgi:hypothetical protein